MTILRTSMKLLPIRVFRVLARALLMAGVFLFTGEGPLLLAEQVAIPLQFQGSQNTVTIHADTQQKGQSVYRLLGHVEITYQDMKLTAHEASYDTASNEIVAQGDVVFTDPQSHIVADQVHYNLRTKKGWFSNGTGFFHATVRPRPRVLKTENPFYFQAAKVDRLNEDTYFIHHGTLTNCECANRGWSFSVRNARVEVNDKLVTHGAMFRLLRTPLFYLPYTVNSIAPRPRQTGFLLPHVGNSSQKGVIIGDGFFWAINPSLNLTLGIENFSKRGLAERVDFGARPSQDSDLTMSFFNVDDRAKRPEHPAPGQSLRMVGKVDNLWQGFRGVLDVDYISSMAFRQTYTDTFREAVSSEARQTGFVYRDFDAYSLGFSASRYQNFLSAAQVPGNSVIIRHTPGVDFSGVDKQLGNTPFYFSFQSSVDGVGRTQPGLEIPRLADRVDFHPELVIRPKEIWHFHFTPTLGVRATHYGTSLKPNQDPLTRLLGEAGLDIRPPSFEKIFSGTYAGRRFKHVIEPDIQYRLVRAHDPADLMDIVLYDLTDLYVETNEVEYSLTNTLLMRKDVSEDSPDKPQAREFISWRIAQKYYFDPTFGGALVPGSRFVFDPTISLTGFAFAQGKHLSPIVSALRVAPFSDYDTEIRVDLSPNGGGVLNAGITSHVRRGLWGLAFTDFFINRTAVFNTPVTPTAVLSQIPSYHFLGALATYGDVNRKGLSAAVGVNYNLEQKIAQQLVSQVSYNFGCFGLDFEYRRFNLGPLRRENQFRVALSLANVGTFGNLKPRERLY
jgi:LPS-assembly protein